MWVTLPAYGAAAYVPALVLERPLFTRSVAPALSFDFHVSTRSPSSERTGLMRLIVD